MLTMCLALFRKYFTNTNSFKPQTNKNLQTSMMKIFFEDLESGSQVQVLHYYITDQNERNFQKYRSRASAKHQ